MIDFPITDVLDEEACLSWLEQHLHPEGVTCPKCGSGERRLAQQHGSWPAWRCKACDRYDTLLGRDGLRENQTAAVESGLVAARDRQGRADRTLGSRTRDRARKRPPITSAPPAKFADQPLGNAIT